MPTDFHKKIGFPEEVTFPTGTFDLSPTTHARQESNRDEYGGFSLPTRIKLTEAMYERDPKEATASGEGETTLPHVFEITVENGWVEKLAARTGYDEKRDIVLVVKPYRNVLITAWINYKGDAHDTLQEENYATPDTIEV